MAVARGVIQPMIVAIKPQPFEALTGSLMFETALDLHPCNAHPFGSQMTNANYDKCVSSKMHTTTKTHGDIDFKNGATKIIVMMTSVKCFNTKYEVWT